MKLTMNHSLAEQVSKQTTCKVDQFVSRFSICSRCGVSETKATGYPASNEQTHVEHAERAEFTQRNRLRTRERSSPAPERTLPLPAEPSGDDQRSETLSRHTDQTSLHEEIALTTFEPTPPGTTLRLMADLAESLVTGKDGRFDEFPQIARRIRTSQFRCKGASEWFCCESLESGGSRLLYQSRISDLSKAQAPPLESPHQKHTTSKVKSSQETRRVVSQFDTAEQAARYSSEFNTHRQLRSRQALIRALEGVEPGAHVLDLPCGTGRLMPLVLELGFSYSGADASGHMVEAARGKLAELQTLSPEALPVSLAVEDVMDLSYPDATFDAVIVNRLFHHYTPAETRISALTELARISRGPVIVFFLNTWTIRGLLFHLKHRADDPMERTPVSLGEFRANGRAAGLDTDRHLSHSRPVQQRMVCSLRVHLSSNSGEINQSSPAPLHS